ncbi:MAG TPA: hypothetical protein VFF67_00820 [Thermoplasmata archaeon]|nr:hypothetical protein [Thermoplasmata archaeon]
MDDLDLDILREMFHGRVLKFGGFYPWVTPAQISRALGVPPSTVKLRLANWRKSGFLHGIALFPHPSLFGLGIYGLALDPESAAGRASIAEALKNHPTAAHVWEPETIHSFYWIGYLDATRASMLEAERMFGRLPGVRVIGDSDDSFPLPECSLDPSHLDWRIIRAVRARPEVPLSKIAAELHVGFRTIAHRFARLVSSHAILCMPRMDFRRTSRTFAMVLLVLSEDADPWELWARVEASRPVVLPFGNWGFPEMTWPAVAKFAENNRSLTYFVSLRTPSEGVNLLRTAERWSGVVRGFLTFPVAIWDIPTPYDAPLERKIRETAHRRPV